LLHGYLEMKRKFNVYNTPIIYPVVRFFTIVAMLLAGWRIEGEQPNLRKYVIIAAPHTSNWDFPLALAMAFYFRISILWMGKDSLFRGFMGPCMRWLGGISVNRSKASNLVEAIVDEFENVESMVVGIPPEGTRAKVRCWKTGFYHIAQGAGVPVVAGYIDTKRKVIGIGDIFTLTGNYTEDMDRIKQFYSDKVGMEFELNEA